MGERGVLLKDERKKYIKRIRVLLPVYGAPERRFMKGLENSLEEYLLEHPAAVLSDFEDRFGAPQDVVREYIANVDVDILYRRLGIAKYIRMVCIGALLTIILLFVIENYRDYKADQVFRENIPYSVEDTIEYLP